MSLDFKDEAILREMSALALEAAIQSIVALATEAADRIERGVLPDPGGAAALRAFAASAKSTSMKVWPKGGQA